MSPVIVAERPDSADAMLLIDELETYLAPQYPAESRHGYSVEKLIRQQVAFFVMRQDGVPAGCGGVQLFGTEYGEVKRMYVRPQFRGLGLAKLMLQQSSRVCGRTGFVHSAPGNRDLPDGSDWPL
jgi:putative acetyltransferase